jgi:hypothetical protein
VVLAADLTRGLKAVHTSGSTADLTLGITADRSHVVRRWRHLVHGDHTLRHDHIVGTEMVGAGRPGGYTPIQLNQ